MVESQLKPIILDLGSQKRKRIKQLKAGDGPLVEDVRDALIEAGVEPTKAGRELVQVVILYEKRRKKSHDRLLSTLLLGK